jgi:aminoglycoside phosphotransferase family enzyme/predicted kinase
MSLPTNDEVSPPVALVRPSAYPPPCPASVTLATTHASWAFITDDEVWKVKRPVNFGFLDYSTPDKRRHMCEEEVRLGARLAPDVYRGVVPLYRGPNGLSFVGPGPVVDTAVRMRRLRDADSARALVDDGRLSRAQLGQLAARLADLYAEAPVERGVAEPARFAANIAENHQQTLPHVGRYVDADLLEHLHQWQQGALAAGTALLQQRMDEGRIREGHGDLRLEHVFFPQGAAQPVVIDPIEFNRRFRCLDVALDVAFLAMELDAAHRSDLAAMFFSHFARAANDFGFYPLLDLYLSYRAWVRAKLACFVAADPGTDPAKSARKAKEAAALFGLALGYTRPKTSCRHVIAVGGMIGSGKSTLADALVGELEIPAVATDATRKANAGLRPQDRGGQELYSAEVTERTYRDVMHKAQQVLSSGRGVVLDATFAHRDSRAAARDLAQREGRPFLFVELTCDEPTLRERLRAREGHPSESDAREAQLATLASRYQPASELPGHERLVLDGRLDVRQMIHAIRERLG